MIKCTALLSAALFGGALAFTSLSTAPAAKAEICAGADGRHVAVGGCTHIAGDVVAGAAIASAATPYVDGEVPCYTVEGAPYYTPPGDPC